MDQGTTHSMRCACGGSLAIHADGNIYRRTHRSIEGTQRHDVVTAAQITAAAPGDDPRYRCPERPPSTNAEPHPEPVDTARWDEPGHDPLADIAAAITAHESRSTNRPKVLMLTLDDCVRLNTARLNPAHAWAVTRDAALGGRITHVYGLVIAEHQRQSAVATAEVALREARRRPLANGGPLPDPAAQPGVYSPRPSPAAPLNTTAARCGCGGFVEWHEDVLRLSMRVKHLTPEGDAWEGEITHQLLAQSSLPSSGLLCPLQLLDDDRERAARREADRWRSRPAPPPAATFVVVVAYADADHARSVVTQADLAAVRAALDAAGLPYTATPATAERAAS